MALAIDTPLLYNLGRHVKMLRAVRSWLEDQDVPRDQWWWNDEHHGTVHPGTVDVAALVDHTIERTTWSPNVRGS